MPGGRWLGVAFLAAFVLMAFLSALAALEVGLVGLRDVGGGRWSRRRMALALFVVEAVLMLPSELGRASCRERVCQYVSISEVDVSLKTTTLSSTDRNKSLNITSRDRQLSDTRKLMKLHKHICELIIY